MNPLTPIQSLALQRNLNLAVTAGAGTGKTRVLVERYLDLLLSRQAHTGEILAITFTSKAAAEMMNRVAGRLDELLQEPEATGSHRHKDLLLLRSRLSSAFISTIHAFCLRILREYPLESDLDPDFLQLNEMQNDLLIEQTIRTELEKISADEQQWLDLFRLFGTGLIHELLRSGIFHRYEMRPVVDTFTRQPDSALYREVCLTFLNKMEYTFKDFPFERIGEMGRNILQAMAASAPEHPQAQILLQTLLRLTAHKDQSEVAFWTDFFSLAQICTTRQATAYKVLTTLGGNKIWSGSSAGLLKQLSETLVPVARWLKDNPLTPPGETDLYVLQQVPVLYRLYTQVEKNYTAAKREQRWVDFDDMQVLIRDLLYTNKTLQTRIAARFKFILVDEFQDTNALQWEIISRLGELIEHKFFIVGDPKQSIYGFRNADVRVFEQVRNTFAGQTPPEAYPGNIMFSESFRFKENISSFLNACFSRLMQRSAANQWEVEYTPLVTMRGDKQGGQVELALLAEEEESDVQARFIAAELRQMLQEQKYQPGQIAVLLRTRSHLTAVEEQLRRQDIPYKTIGGIGFYQRQEIYDVYHLLRFLLNPRDDAALVGLLRSPFANIADEGLLFLALENEHPAYWERIVHLEEIKTVPAAEREKLEYFREQAGRWLNRRDRIGFSELLREIFLQSGYRAVMCAQLQGEQLAANLDKILDLAGDFEQGGFTTVADFTNYLQNLIHTQIREGEAPLALEDRFTVKVMTIHQAKGLEFPVVFLPYLEQKICPPRGEETYFDEQFGLLGRIRREGLPAGYTMGESFCMLDLVRQELRRKELAELKRLFYVGCTRAQDKIILSATAKTRQVPDETPLAWLLQGMQRTAEDLHDGESINWDTCTLLVRRTFPAGIPDYDLVFSRIFHSLQGINEQLGTRSATSGPPLFFKTAAGRPAGEIFSATQLMAFRQDAREYFRRYHLGYFEADYENFRLASSAEEKSLLKGKLLHRYLQFYPRQDITRWLFEFEITDEILIRELSMEIHDLAAKVAESPFIKPLLNLSSADYRNEVKVMMKLGEDYIGGTLDKIFKNKDGHWEVLDYKTNRIGRSQVAETLERYRIQSQTYALLLAHLYPQQEQYSVNFYFTQLDFNQQERYSKKDISQIEQEFGQVITEIKGCFEPYCKGPGTGT
jgi:ATP-dependent helicase/nuclease subunit A